MPHHGHAEGNSKMPSKHELEEKTARTPETGVQEVTSAVLAEKGHEIRGLRFDGLDNTKGTGYSERVDEVKNLGTKLLSAGTRNEGYVYLDKNGKVAVFMELERDINSRKLKVKQLFMAHPSGHGQNGMIQSLIRQAHNDFHGRGYHHMVFDDSNIRKDLLKAKGHLSFGGLANFIQKGEDGEAEPANDNIAPEENDESEAGPEQLAA